MNTVFLGSEQVDAYLLDFAKRLIATKDAFPFLWCTLGHSGEALAARLLKHLPTDLLDKVLIVRMHFDRNKKEAILEDPKDQAALATTLQALVIDSSVHSGTAMAITVSAVQKLGVRRICTYGLVLKRGSGFIPNYFGVVIGDHDRAYFLLDSIPNNRLMPFGVVRRLREDDVKRTPQSIDCGVASLDRVTWADRFYDSKAHGSQVFVYEEDDTIFALVSFEIRETGTLVVDALATNRKRHGQRLAPQLMRWAETSARCANCHSMSLWAIEERIKFYSDMGFVKKGDTLDLGEEKYHLMQRTLLYNLRPKDDA